MQREVQFPLLFLLTSSLGLIGAERVVVLPEECKVPEPDPRCRANFPAWICNETTGYCEFLPNGKCLSKGWFSTAKECNTKCRDPFLGICAQPLVPGQCRTSWRRYAFSPQMRQCLLHVGGYYSEANKNNFATFKECNDTCGGFAQDPCLLPQDEGTQCRNRRSAPRGSSVYFSFNKETETCDQFTHKGCGGNRNRFIEETECWRVCSRHITNRCHMPISSGHACPQIREGVKYRAHGYNPKTKRCETFFFEGCGGNENKFPTAKECWDTCASASSTKCLKKAALNPLGIGWNKKFYYNKESDECLSTRYFTSSNEGRNRFNTLAECEQECKAPYKGGATWMEF